MTQYRKKLKFAADGILELNDPKHLKYEKNMRWNKFSTEVRFSVNGSFCFIVMAQRQYGLD